LVRLIFAINYKAYETAFNERSLDIARAASRLSSRYQGVRIILVVPAAVVGRVLQAYEDVYVEHVDPIDFGAYTGYLPASAARLIGAKGVLTNHSEHKMVYRDVEKVVKAARAQGLEVMACADTPGEAAGLAYLRPDFIAIEPPELIGTGVSRGLRTAWCSSCTGLCPLGSRLARSQAKWLIGLRVWIIH